MKTPFSGDKFSHQMAIYGEVVAGMGQAHCTALMSDVTCAFEEYAESRAAESDSEIDLTGDEDSDCADVVQPVNLAALDEDSDLE